MNPDISNNNILQATENLQLKLIKISAISTRICPKTILTFIAVILAYKFHLLKTNHENQTQTKIERITTFLILILVLVLIICLPFFLLI